MISILSYGAGNIRSISNICHAAGLAAEVIETPEQVRAADKLLLPGVGAFDYGMKRLRETGLADALDEATKRKGTPLLGICLGMQLMCKTSEEGELPGLGWIDADVTRFQPTAEQPGLRIPHMGWNSPTVLKDTSVIPRGDSRQRFYFVHSYYVGCHDETDVVATAFHGRNFVAAFQRDNLHGVQFHPEKSHKYGMALMQQFGRI